MQTNWIMKNLKLVMIIATIVVVIIVIIVVVSVVIAKKKPKSDSNLSPQVPSYKWTIINNTSVIIPNVSVLLGNYETEKSTIPPKKQAVFYIPKNHDYMSLFKAKFIGGTSNFFIGDHSGYCPGTYTISFDSSKEGGVAITANEVNCPESEAEFNSSFPPMNINPESIISFPPMNMYSHSPM